MRRHLRRAGLAFLLVSALPLAAANDKKDLDKERKEPEKFVPLGQYTGVLTNLGGSDRVLTVKIVQRYPEPNPSAFQQQRNLMQRQVEIMRNPNLNPLQRQQQLAQLQIDMAKNQQNLYTLKSGDKEVQVQAAADLKVRYAQPPPAFDDKGNPRKYTQQELKDLRGDGKLPGYKGDYDSLRTGQTVTVQLARKKDGNPGPPKGKDLDKDPDKKLLEAERPYVTLIVIVGEAANP